MGLLLRGRRARLLASLSIALLAMLLATGPVLAAVTWGSSHQASTDRAYTWGRALARTVTTGGTAYLHHVFTRDFIGGTVAQDGGPYLGVYYRRGSSSGSTWGTSKRLNSTSQHGDFGTVAGKGKYVFVAWRRQIHVGASYSSSDQRQLYFIRNTNHGSSSAWLARQTFNGAYYIDRPSIAAASTRVFIVYTDTIGGEIRLQRSTDNGATFNYTAVGATDSSGPDGYSGEPVVAAAGSLVAIAWRTNAEVLYRVSTDGGAHFSSVATLSAGTSETIGIAAKSGRWAAAWNNGGQTAIYSRVWNNGTLGAQSTIATFSDATTYKVGNRPAVALAGTTTVAVAWSACTADGCPTTSSNGEDIRWRESTNNGSTWKSSIKVASYTTSSSRRGNEFPSILMTSTTRRVVLWNAFGGTSYRTLVRVGTGSP